MEVILIVSGGKNSGHEIPVSAPKFFVGRAEDCHLRPHSDQVSRHHCAILIEEGAVLVRDFGSKNGTYVNGQRVKTERELKTGDRLSVGPLDFEVRLVVETKGKKKPKVKSIQEAAARTVEAAGSQSPAGEDADVADWLMDDEELEPSTADSLVDTDTIGAVPTEHIETVEPFAGLIPDVTAPDEPADKEKKKKKETKIVGKFEGSKKPVADSSRDAAADVLREFFKRK